MSYELLGESFDIHGGGNDLMFPHHENEIAQSHAARTREGGFANVWMHNEMLQVEGKKMSKSLGNFFTVHDLLEGHDGQPPVPGEVIRFVFLSTHYRKPMDWTAEKVREAEKTLRNWRKATRDVEPGLVVDRVVQSLSDDLNTPGAIAELHWMYRALQREASVAPEANLALGMRRNLLASARALGLLTDELSGWDSVEADLTDWIDRLAKTRALAMETKDFTEVDVLKVALIEAGIEVRMSKDGIDLVPGPDFDPAKLEVLK